MNIKELEQQVDALAEEIETIKSTSEYEEADDEFTFDEIGTTYIWSDGSQGDMPEILVQVEEMERKLCQLRAQLHFAMAKPLWPDAIYNKLPKYESELWYDICTDTWLRGWEKDPICAILEGGRWFKFELLYEVLAAGYLDYLHDKPAVKLRVLRKLQESYNLGYLERSRQHVHDYVGKNMAPDI